MRSNFNIAVCLSCLILLLVACGGAPSIREGNSQKDLDVMSGPASKVLVMALYPEQDTETRVVIENAVVGGFRQSGVEASAGYRVFETYSGLATQVAEVKEAMEAGGFNALLLVDPIRVKSHDPGEWAERRSAYRAFDMSTAATFNLIGQLSEEADAAKAEIDVTVWDLGSGSFVWHTEYDFNAPGSYDLEVARQYADEFAKMLSNKLRSEGVVQ